ncbi:hypothetical protein B5V02_24425 [Mesorhizobium kowhaii]|uniref:Uncharacterized protein n=1 Tax=Mesorhizobium kowhaii TaxID=1300272 RepID=A0A2W7CRE7_9HYPH|nr:hypothetical protein B5V02_24425 [Mesorhizobium kowhaii]
MLKHIHAVDGFASALASDVNEMFELAAQTSVDAGCSLPAAQSYGICSMHRKEVQTSALPVVALIAPVPAYRAAEIRKR